MSNIFVNKRIHLLLLMTLSSSLCSPSIKVPGDRRYGSVTMESDGRYRKFGISMFVPHDESFPMDEPVSDSRYAARESPPMSTVYWNSSLGKNPLDSGIMKDEGNLHGYVFEEVVVSQPSPVKGKKPKLIHCQQVGSVFVSIENPPIVPAATITIVKN